MVYEKQKFVDGQVLEAQHLNNIEDGIANVHQFLTGESTIFSQSIATGGLNMYTASPAPFTLIEGGTYEVTIDGVGAEVVCGKNSIDGKNSLALISSMKYGIHYLTPEESGESGGKVIIFMNPFSEEPISNMVEITQLSIEGTVLQIQNGEARWVESSDGSSGSSVSSWNDITDKPFYEEGSRVLLIEETKIDGFTQNPDYGLYFAYDTKPFSLAPGETYTVLWDGDEYVVTAQDASAVTGAELIAMGNGSAWGMSGNEEPFIVATDATTMYFFASDPNDSAASHDIGIYQGATVIQTLDEKYLPMDAIDNRIETYISSALEGDY